MESTHALSPVSDPLIDLLHRQNLMENVDDGSV